MYTGWLKVHLIAFLGVGLINKYFNCATFPVQSPIYYRILIYSAPCLIKYHYIC